MQEEPVADGKDLDHDFGAKLLLGDAEGAGQRRAMSRRGHLLLPFPAIDAIGVDSDQTPQRLVIEAGGLSSLAYHTAEARRHHWHSL